MNWFRDDKSVCGLFEGKRCPTPEDDDGDEDDESGETSVVDVIAALEEQENEHTD